MVAAGRWLLRLHFGRVQSLPRPPRGSRGVPCGNGGGGSAQWLPGSQPTAFDWNSTRSSQPAAFFWGRMSYTSVYLRISDSSKYLRIFFEAFLISPQKNFVSFGDFEEEEGARDFVLVLAMRPNEGSSPNCVERSRVVPGDPRIMQTLLRLAILLIPRTLS